MSRFAPILLVVVGLLAAIGYTSLYVVDQRQQALVLEFGNPQRTVREPGLQFKKPWQTVLQFDKRLLDFDADAQEVTLGDQRRMVVDAYARYKITDPLEFYKTIGSEVNFRQRLGAIVNATLRNTLGQVPFAALLSDRRASVMRDVRDVVAREAASFGVTVVDVRFMRADLHAENSPAIFRRMQTERDREAREARGQGSEAKQRITAEAERERTILLAEAQREAQVLRGQGDADATRIYAEAFGRDPKFYDFWRSLEAQRKALAEGTTLILSPDSDFFRFFRDMGGAEGATPRR
ncbi:MAG: protease modulator HflC [Alphaproteobacteria bacterium]|nr:protease modulator HflC [Alphaproteobacteria bacterium]